MANMTEITLGGLKYGIGQLTIGQLIEVQALQMTVRTKEPEETRDDAFMRALGKRMVSTLAAAMTKVAPEITAEKISDTPMTMTELNVAYTAVLVHAGLIVKEPVPGEVPKRGDVSP
jgi:hypothetical protein